jgi:lysozyme
MSVPRACIVLLSLALPFAASAENSVLSLSHYDECALDFAGLQRGGLTGIIHEATYPSEADAKYGYRESAAMRAGLLWGAYHFGNNTDGHRQADSYLDVVASRWTQAHNPAQPSGVLLVLDAENNTHYPGGSMDVAQAVRFIERVHERTGLYPGLYSNENWIKRVFNSPAIDDNSRQILRKCWLWIANYHNQPASTAPWSNWALWQYTGDGVCGLPRRSYPTSFANLRRVERTIFSGNRSSLRQFWTEHAWLPEKETVAQQ